MPVGAGGAHPLHAAGPVSQQACPHARIDLAQGDCPRVDQAAVSAAPLGAEFIHPAQRVGKVQGVAEQVVDRRRAGKQPQ